jgi:hypothetical protein
VQRTRARRQAFGGVRFLLPILLTLLLGGLAYQIPVRAHIAVGQLGDQLFLPSSESQRAEQIAQGAWYADQLDLDGRSRWSRARATLRLPGLGQGRPIQLTLDAAGWPADVVGAAVAQPTVEVRVGSRLVDSFRPGPERAPHTITIPAEVQTAGPLTITLESSATFTDTARYTDPRPKGIRLAGIDVAAGGPGTRPDWLTLGGLALATALALGVAQRGPGSAARRRWLAPLAGLGMALLGVTALLVVRLWLAALLPWLLLGLALLLALLCWRWWRRLWRAVRWRMRDSTALDAGLIAALLLLCAYLALRPLLTSATPLFPSGGDPLLPESGDRYLRILARLSLLSGVALALVASVTLLPQWALQLRRRLITGRLAAALLGLAAGVWLGYEAWLIATLPFVGHADYADNAVVARNLLRGRGWVVDYVSQFYSLVPGGAVTRPQETWPLLQPLLMLPSFALWGPAPWAARVPNLLFLTALTLLIFHIGARIWDRRVGLIAALLTLTNLFFFRLAIFTTSDLALVVWSMAAFWLVFQATTQVQRIGNREQGTNEQTNKRTANREPQRRSRFLFLAPLFSVVSSLCSSRWLWAGVFSGLMILQKPSAAIMVLGMGLWALWFSRYRTAGQPERLSLRAWLRRRLPALVLWTAITVLVVSPFIVRNLRVFGAPFFSTESYDAWVLYFRGTGDEAWEDIYKVYAPELTDIGQPNRSWILRWGYDLTLGKLATQARDAWDFFAPPKGKLLGYDSDGIAATWLLLLGLLTLRPRQRRLAALVGLPLLLYTAFLVLYWHTHEEQRYFVAFIPWLALVAAGGACWLFDRIAAIGRGRWAGLAGLALSAALISAVAPHWREIDAELDPQNPSYWGVDWVAELEAYAWIAQNTPRDAVIMTRAPWQLTYHADRAALMIPNAGWEQIMQIARYYGADYLVTNNFTTSLPESRGDLKPLASGEALPGWTLVQTFADRYNGAPVRIYRIPPDYAGTPPIAGRK